MGSESALHGSSRQRGSGGALQEVWLPSVLNVGVRPDVAVRRARRRFEEQGGVVREHTACDGVVVGEKSAQVTLAEEVITTRLVVDAMGNASPIARQARREANDGADPKPSGICCVVGTLMRGFDADNSFGDLIYTNEDARVGGPDRQYFWEAFPAMAVGADARTTYLFTYMDADELRELSEGWAFRNSDTTIDNGATYTEIEFLARVLYAKREEGDGLGLEGRYRRAITDGIDFLLQAQYPNGGWPQYYPPRDGYKGYVTFNDLSLIHI